MELIQPGIGLIFWMTLSFGAVLFILWKFAWPAVLKGLKEREQSIQDALDSAEKAKKQMESLKADNEILLKQAKEERDALLAEARKAKEKILDEAREKAKTEAARIVDSAAEAIENQKKAALIDLRNEIAILSIEVAEKILNEELKEKGRHDELIRRMIRESENRN
jgi:F-type H+-transporting ATPase subunit b